HGIVEKGRQDPRSRRAPPDPPRYTPPRFGNPSSPLPNLPPGTAEPSFHNCGKSLWTMTLPLAEPSPGAPAGAAEVWDAVQELVKPALSDGSYRMWFAGVGARSVDEAGLELEAPSDYVKNWLVSHYLELLTDSTRSVLGPQAAVRI